MPNMELLLALPLATLLGSFILIQSMKKKLILPPCWDFIFALIFLSLWAVCETSFFIIGHRLLSMLLANLDLALVAASIYFIMKTGISLNGRDMTFSEKILALSVLLIIPYMIFVPFNVIPTPFGLQPSFDTLGFNLWLLIVAITVTHASCLFWSARARIKQGVSYFTVPILILFMVMAETLILLHNKYPYTFPAISSFGALLFASSVYVIYFKGENCSKMRSALGGAR